MPSRLRYACCPQPRRSARLGRSCAWLALALLVPALPARAVQFRFPVDNADDPIYANWVIHCDHDTLTDGERTACLDFAGRQNFPYCYNDHLGTDFILEGGVSAMEAESATVVAAADGVVVSVEDGNYDHCHGSMDTGDVTCDGYPMQANQVILEHPDGYRSIYAHFRRDSIVVAVGERVRCGEPLGLIGSSGYSSMPHVHFQVETPAGQWIDPYAGPESQPESFWVEQDGPKGLPAERCADEPPLEPLADGPGPGDVAGPAPADAADTPGAADAPAGDALPDGDWNLFGRGGCASAAPAARNLWAGLILGCGALARRRRRPSASDSRPTPRL